MDFEIQDMKMSQQQNQPTIQQNTKPEISTTFPAITKKELLSLFKKESPEKQKYKQFQIIFELKKVKQNVGLIRLEIYEGGKQEFCASVFLPINKPVVGQAPTAWDGMKVGKSQVFGLVIDSREQSLLEKVKGFFIRSFEQGKLQEFIPFLNAKK
jgi:hypothetical protein